MGKVKSKVILKPSTISLQSSSLRVEQGQEMFQNVARFDFYLLTSLILSLRITAQASFLIRQQL